MGVKQTIASYDRIAPEYARRWRDRAVMAPALARFTAALPAGALLLDVGCGPGFDGAILRSNGFRVVGLDLSRGMLEAARMEYPGAYVQADMRRLPLRPGVDGVWCNAALLHLSRADAASALRDFHRVLAPGGILYLALKEGQGEEQRSDAYGPDVPRYFTYWLDDQLDEALRAAGFRRLDGWTDGENGQRWLCRLLLRT